MSNTQDQINTGVIGTGNMGRHHARVYNELPDSNLVGVYDIDADQAEKVAAKHGTESLEFEELLERVDAVSVAVPTLHHYDTVKQCLERGVHVLVEKPFVDNRSQGEELIEIAEENNVQIQVGHIERFNPAVVALQDIVPDIDIINIDAERLGPPLDRDMEDSVVEDLMIHDIDILLWLINSEVSSISTFDSDEAYTTANFQFEDGTIARLTASRVTQRRFENSQLPLTRVGSRSTTSTGLLRFIATRFQSILKKTETSVTATKVSLSVRWLEMRSH